MKCIFYIIIVIDFHTLEEGAQKKLEFVINLGLSKLQFYIFTFFFCSLTDRLINKIFIEQMLI